MDVDLQFTGKYETAGRLGSWFLNNFYREVTNLAHIGLASICSKPMVRALEMGCGAGFSTQRLIDGLGQRMMLEGCDIGDSLVEKARRRNPGTPFAIDSVYSSQYEDKEFDVTFLLEVLEHLEHPDEALREMARITRSWLILSTPREPIWRAMNMARGKYLGSLGNTPGHIQHWSRRSLCKQVSRHFQVMDCRCPLPWTILLLRPR